MPKTYDDELYDSDPPRRLTLRQRIHRYLQGPPGPPGPVGPSGGAPLPPEPDWVELHRGLEVGFWGFDSGGSATRLADRAIAVLQKQWR